MFAIIQQDNKIHEPHTPQRGERRATVTGQSECGHHDVGYRGGIGDSGQLDHTDAAAMGGPAAPGDLAGKRALADTAGPDDRDQGSAIDDLSQRGQVLVTAQQLVTGRRGSRPVRRRNGCVEGVALGLPQPFGRLSPKSDSAS